MSRSSISRGTWPSCLTVAAWERPCVLRHFRWVARCSLGRLRLLRCGTRRSLSGSRRSAVLLLHADAPVSRRAGRLGPEFRSWCSLLLRLLPRGCPCRHLVKKLHILIRLVLLGRPCRWQVVLPTYPLVAWLALVIDAPQVLWPILHDLPACSLPTHRAGNDVHRRGFTQGHKHQGRVQDQGSFTCVGNSAAVLVLVAFC